MKQSVKNGKPKKRTSPCVQSEGVISRKIRGGDHDLGARPHLQILSGFFIDQIAGFELCKTKIKKTAIFKLLILFGTV